MAMSDEGGNFNASKYKSAFTNGSTKKDFVKHTPFKFVKANEMERAAMGFKSESHPTPTNPQKGG